MKKKTVLIWVIATVAALLVCAAVVGMISGAQGSNDHKSGNSDNAAEETTKSGVVSDVIEFDDLWDKATYGQD